MSHKNFEHTDNVENVEQGEKAEKLESKETCMDKIKNLFKKDKEGNEKQDTNERIDEIEKEMADEKKEFRERLRYDVSANSSKAENENKKTDTQSEDEDENTHGENGERTRHSDLKYSMKNREEELER